MKKVKKITKHKKRNKHSALKPNRQYKDSVFVDLFSVDEQTRNEAVISLYNALHEKKIIMKEQVHFVRLKMFYFVKYIMMFLLS